MQNRIPPDLSQLVYVFVFLTLWPLLYFSDSVAAFSKGLFSEKAAAFISLEAPIHYIVE